MKLVARIVATALASLALSHTAMPMDPPKPTDTPRSRNIPQITISSDQAPSTDQAPSSDQAPVQDISDQTADNSPIITIPGTLWDLDSLRSNQKRRSAEGSQKSMSAEGSPSSQRVKGSPKPSRAEGSPKLKRTEISPKGSPKPKRIEGSPKPKRTESSPKGSPKNSPILLRAAQKLVDLTARGLPKNKTINPQDSLYSPFFGIIPPDQQKIILGIIISGANAETLDVACSAISSLSLVNKYLEALINEEQFCRKIIKRLAQKFEIDQMTVCLALKIPVVKKIRMTQISLSSFCSTLYLAQSNSSQITIEELYQELLKYIEKENADLNFTYQGLTTPVIIAMKKNPLAARAFIKAGADLNCTDASGNSPLSIAKESGDNDLIAEVKKALNLE